MLAKAAVTGPNTLRYSVDETFTATGVDPNATGRVLALVKQDGSAGAQRLRVSVAHLDPRTPYTLLAEVGDARTVVEVGGFTTTTLGRGTFTLSQSSSPIRRAVRRTLPEGLEPLTGVRTLFVVNTNGENILAVALHASPSMSFALSSVFANTGSDPAAIGCLAAACQNGSVQFRLFAAGQGSQFTFCVNDSPVATYPAGAGGRISIGVLPRSAPSPLLFQKLCVRNAANEVVLQSSVR